MEKRTCKQMMNKQKRIERRGEKRRGDNSKEEEKQVKRSGNALGLQSSKTNKPTY